MHEERRLVVNDDAGGRLVSEEGVAGLQGVEVDGEVGGAGGENAGRVVKMVERAGETGVCEMRRGSVGG